MSLLPFGLNPCYLMPSTYTKYLLALILLSSLTACTLTPNTFKPFESVEHQASRADAKVSASDNQKTTNNTSVDTTIASRPFDSETLFALLVAEIAGSRQHPEITLAQYLDQAKKTRDPQLAERAAYIADFMHLPITMTQAGALWEELDPGNPKALMIMSQGQINQMHLDEAFRLSLKLLDSGHSGMFDLIANQAVEFGNEQESLALLAKYNKILKHRPHAARLIMGKATLLNHLGKSEDAIKTMRMAIHASSDSSTTTTAYLLLANMLTENGSDEQALKIVEKQVKKQPENNQLRFEYGRLLINKDLKKAEAQFLILLQKEPENPETLLSLALIYKELGDNENMLYYFYRLIYMGRFIDTAHLELGEYALKNGNIPEAVKHLKQVEHGREYFTALQLQLDILLETNQLPLAFELSNRHQLRYPERETQILLLEAESLQRHDYFEESIDVLNRAITRYPDNPDYYYSRSLALEKSSRIPEAEQDLRHMLTLTPQNPMAMNALGYLLLVHNGPTAESAALLTSAIKAAPDDPAIMDSYAWLLFQKGETKSALDIIKKAFLLFPNHEVAAHLGELLWVSGHHDQARTIWLKGLEDKADSVIIKETRQRLGVTNN